MADKTENKPGFVARAKAAVKNFGARVSKFFRDTKSELKKVVWPTWPETVKMYSAVLVFVLIMIAIVGLLDLAFGWGLLKIFGS